MKTWEKMTNFLGVQSNSVIRGKGFFVSYNPNTASSGKVWQGSSLTETALCKPGKYYVLDGDFRKQYEELIDKGWKACKKFYDDNKELYDSKWSSD